MISEDHLFEYEVRPDGAVITRFLGLPASADSLSVLVPDTLGGAPVTAIAPRAFSDNGTTLMEIHLPDALRSIGEEAFAYCYLLERLDLGHGVETIGGGFLSFCGSMEELTLPASVRQIDRPYLLNALRVKTDQDPKYFDAKHGSAAPEDRQKRSRQRQSEPQQGPHESPERSGRGRFVSDGFALYERLTECGGPAGFAAPLRLISVSSASERSSYAVLPGTVAIGVPAFEGQSHLCDLILPDTLEAIGDHAFRDSPALSCFDLPASVRRIGEAALDSMKVEGRIDGTVLCNQSAEFSSTGSMKGNLSTGTLKTADGAVFEGKLNMLPPRKEAPAKKAPEAAPQAKAQAAPATGDLKAAVNAVQGDAKSEELSKLSLQEAFAQERKGR